MIIISIIIINIIIIMRMGGVFISIVVVRGHC